jgi:hypothetical protein
MDSLELEFKNEVIIYLEYVNKENFHLCYDGLVSIIYKFKELGLSKDAVKNAISQICQMPLSDWQDEVVMEISNILHDYCSPNHKINW